MVLARGFDGPRPARPGETAEVYRLIQGIFGNPHFSMLPEYPHLYGDMEAHLDWCHVITHRGRIVSHTGIYPLRFVAGPRSVMVGGIGAVATEPAYRGKGMMSAFLDYSTRWMRSHGMPVSILWGDRLRYARYGWEPAGLSWGFGINQRSAGALAKFREPVRELEGAGPHLDALFGLHQALPLRVDRDPGEFGLVLGKAGRRIFAAFGGRKPTAFVVASGRREGGGKRPGDWWNIQMMAGSRTGILSIIRWFLAGPGTRGVGGQVPVEWRNYLNDLIDCADHWGGTGLSALGQVKVVDLKGTMSALGAGGLAPAVGGLGLSVTGQARILFGPLPPSALLSPARARKFAGRLPLPFYLWPLDHV
jgi:GNAT superfamily N-acetyltransferase